MKIAQLTTYLIFSACLAAQGIDPAALARELTLEMEDADAGGVLGAPIPDFGFGVEAEVEPEAAPAIVDIEDLAQNLPFYVASIAAAPQRRRRAPVGRMRPSPSTQFCRQQTSSKRREI